MSFICDKCGTDDCDNCQDKVKNNNYILCLNDGTPIVDVAYKPKIGAIIKIDDVEKWYKVLHVNKHQKWCLCRELPDPNF